MLHSCEHVLDQMAVLVQIPIHRVVTQGVVFASRDNRYAASRFDLLSQRLTILGLVGDDILAFRCAVE